MNKLIIFGLCMILLISFSSAYELEFYHSDHLGSPVLVTKENQSVVWSSDYDVFGEAVNEEGTGDLKYNQKEKDTTGLLYYGARYYNADAGRFITADTVKGEMTDLQSQNLYVYVQNNPMKFIDPTGNQLSNTALAKFGLRHPFISKTLYSEGISGLSTSDKQTALLWGANYFKKEGFTYAGKYLEMFINPKLQKDLPSSTYSDFFPNAKESIGGTYSVYDMTADWMDAGFDTNKISTLMTAAPDWARYPSKILQGYNSGEETLLFTKGSVFSPFELEALGDFSFYIQKGTNGNAILRVKDFYNWDSGKPSVFTSNIPGLTLTRLGLTFAEQSDKSTMIGVIDNQMKGLGKNYLMVAEFEIPEQLFLDQNWE